MRTEWRARTICEWPSRAGGTYRPKPNMRLSAVRLRTRGPGRRYPAKHSAFISYPNQPTHPPRNPGGAVELEERSEDIEVARSLWAEANHSQNVVWERSSCTASWLGRWRVTRRVAME